MANEYQPASHIRVYDKVIYDWLGTLLVDYGNIFSVLYPSKEILRVYSSPERAFAEMYRMLVRKGYLDKNNSGDGSLEGYNNVESYRMTPTPFASFFRPSVPQYNSNRMSWGKIRTVSRSDSQGEVTHRDRTFEINYPKPFDIQYQIDIWCKKMYTMVWLEEWLMAQYGRRGCWPQEIQRTAYFPDFIGSRICPLIIDGLSDTSEIEGTEGEYVRRFTIDLTARAWFFTIPTEKQPILYGEFDWYDMREEAGTDKQDILIENQETFPSLLEPSYFKLPDSDSTSVLRCSDTGILDFIPGGDPDNKIISAEFGTPDVITKLYATVYNTQSMTIRVYDKDNIVVASTVVIPAQNPSNPNEVTLEFQGEHVNIIQIETEGFATFSNLSCVPSEDVGD